MFVNPRDPGNTAIQAKLREWIVSFPQVPDDVVISVREVTCSDPGCNHTDTHILIESSGYTKELIIRKPLVYIRKWDIVL